MVPDCAGLTRSPCYDLFRNSSKVSPPSAASTDNAGSQSYFTVTSVLSFHSVINHTREWIKGHNFT